MTSKNNIAARKTELIKSMNRLLGYLIRETRGHDSKITDVVAQTFHGRLKSIESEFQDVFLFLNEKMLSSGWGDYTSSRTDVFSLIHRLHQQPKLQVAARTIERKRQGLASPMSPAVAPLAATVEAFATAGLGSDSEGHQSRPADQVPEPARRGRPSRAAVVARNAAQAQVTSEAKARRQAEIQAGRLDPWTMPYPTTVQPTSMTEAFAVIKAAREVVTQEMRSRISTMPDSTRDSYEKTLKTMGHFRPEIYARSKPRFYVARSALRYGAERDVIEALSRQSSLQREMAKITQGHPDHNALLRGFLEEVGRLQAAMSRLKVIETMYPRGCGVPPAPLIPGQVPQSRFDVMRERATGEKVEKVRTKASKRKGLARLQDNWEDVIVDRAWSSGSKHAQAIAVLAMSGCRPIELTHGVKLRVSSDGKTIAAVITNGKPRRGRTDGARTLEFDADSSAASQHLTALLGPGGSGTVQIDGHERHRKALNASIARFAIAVKVCGPGARVTAYSFRHQLGADAKSQGWNEERIAMLLGHSSEEMQAYYGAAVQGRRNGAGTYLPKSVGSEKAITKKVVPRAQRTAALKRLDKAIDAKHKTKGGAKAGVVRQMSY